MKNNQLRKKIVTLLSSWQFWLVLIFLLGAFLRFYNYTETLYFVYDQGRDALKLRDIVGGDITLLGPTSGLAGFFLGPLWYYAGVPGYILSGGNPYSISLWYIFLTLLAIPFFWLSSKKLFKNNQTLALLSTFLLTVVAGSIKGSTFIWNPLIAIPLMAAAFYALIKARTSNIALGVAFLLVGFTLQSEFAYAIFYIPALLLLIPWIKQRFKLQDFFVAIGSVAVTGVPQLVFELKNRFLLTQNLWAGVTSTEGQYGYIDLWKDRPTQLLDTTSALLFGGIDSKNILSFLFILTTAICLLFYFKQQTNKSVKNSSQSERYSWKLLTILMLIPYIGYMFWRGNYGKFFDYYITSHFIFLVPFLVLPFKLLHSKKFSALTKIGAALAGSLLISGAILGSYTYARDIVIFPNNQAGMTRTIEAVETLQSWRDQAGVEQGTFLVFTPSYQTEHYDYLIEWLSRSQNKPVPFSQRQGNETDWFLMMEEDRDLPEKRFYPWYEEATAGGQLVERVKTNVLTLEWWTATPTADEDNDETSQE